MSTPEPPEHDALPFAAQQAEIVAAGLAYEAHHYHYCQRCAESYDCYCDAPEIQTLALALACDKHRTQR